MSASRHLLNVPYEEGFHHAARCNLLEKKKRNNLGYQIFIRNIRNNLANENETFLRKPYRVIWISVL